MCAVDVEVDMGRHVRLPLLKRASLLYLGSLCGERFTLDRNKISFITQELLHIALIVIKHVHSNTQLKKDKGR